MLRQVFIRFLRVDDALGALAQGTFEEWDCPCGICRQPVRKFFIIRYEVCNVNIAIVLLDKSVLSNLVSVDECAVYLESKDEFP